MLFVVPPRSCCTPRAIVATQTSHPPPFVPNSTCSADPASCTIQPVLYVVPRCVPHLRRHAPCGTDPQSAAPHPTFYTTCPVRCSLLSCALNLTDCIMAPRAVPHPVGTQTPRGLPFLPPVVHNSNASLENNSCPTPCARADECPDSGVGWAPTRPGVRTTRHW